jgi:hypothetical protein
LEFYKPGRSGDWFYFSCRGKNDFHNEEEVVLSFEITREYEKLNLSPEGKL